MRVNRFGSFPGVLLWKSFALAIDRMWPIGRIEGRGARGETKRGPASHETGVITPQHEDLPDVYQRNERDLPSNQNYV